jgi:hypothetical protein
MKNLNKEQYLGVIRHLLTLGGGYLLMKGFIDANYYEVAIASIMGVIGTLWSIKNKA